jgi:MFS transporter, FLVCR family, feline leukemia virus subgroup C receptor-related protein
MIVSASNGEQEQRNTSESVSEHVYRVYPRRFAILAIFCLCSLSNGFQWIEYVIIQNIIVRYYNQSLPYANEAKNNAVIWTSLTYMVIILISISK